MIGRCGALAGALLLLMAGQAAARDDKAAIQALDDRFSAAFTRGDGAAVAAFYTDDAVLMPPGAAKLQGKAAVQAFWAAGVQQLTDGKLTAVTVTRHSPTVIEEVGSFTMRTRGTPPQTLTGKYVVIWRKVGDDDWKMATDIWNADP